MARLTRTQKYAELRNQLESDRETQLKTDDLSKYSDKLEQLSVNPLPDENREKELSKESLDRSLDDILKVMNDEVQEHLAREEAIEDKGDTDVFDHAKEDVVSAEPIEESVSDNEADKAFKDAKEGQNEDKKAKEGDEVQMIIDSLTSSLGKDDTSEKVSELDLLTRKTEVTQLNNQHKLEKVEDKQKETKETVDIVENKKKQGIESHSNQDKESKNITAEKMHSSTQNSTKTEEITTDKTEQQHKAGRKPVKIDGWLFTYIKQEYLSDSQTTEEMRAQFANMSCEEQFSYLYNNRNQLIKQAKAEVQTAIANYEKLSPEKCAELDDLCATYPTFALKLEKKKDEIAKKQAEEIKAIRERTAKYKKELRESKKGPENNIKEFFQSL